jgi:radical SAM superfamily enzyme YgiQ (UPF0313 family)
MNRWQSITAAERILGREQGTLVKSWGGNFPIALAYPNQYNVAMSSLGFQAVYGLFNSLPGVVCERVFYGAPGMPAHDAAAISLESQRPLDSFPVIAFSLPFEIDYLNAIDMIGLWGIPLHSGDRDDSHPLLIAGGPAVTANPLPLSTIFDAFAIGEGEVIIPPMAQALIETVPEGRAAILKALAQIPGLYVPDIHGPRADSSVVRPVRRQWVEDLDAYETHSIVLTPDTELSSMYLIEIARGCVRHCPFCLAGHAYQPHRQRSLDAVLKQAREGLQYRNRVGLVSAAASDYGHIDELVTALREVGARISVSSLRVRPLSETLVRALAESGDQTLTIAPEAGSERLRGFIQKGVTEDDLFRATEVAQRYGFRQLKLYFMIGLPTETEDDVQAIADLSKRVAAVFARQVTVNVTPFVPKAHTPFERVAMLPENDIEARLKLLSEQLRVKGIELRSDGAKWAVVQGVLARGDCAVSLALEQLARPSLKEWDRLVRKAGLQPEPYLGARTDCELLPWGAIGL